MTFDLPVSMAAGTEFSAPSSVLEVGCNKDNAAALADEVSDSLSDLKQMTNRKPPRYSSALRHSVSSIGPQTADDLVSILFSWLLSYQYSYGWSKCIE